MMLKIRGQRKIDDLLEPKFRSDYFNIPIENKWIFDTIYPLKATLINNTSFLLRQHIETRYQNTL